MIYDFEEKLEGHILILGIRTSGNKFRPSSWAEMKAGHPLVSEHCRSSKRHKKHEKRYHTLLVPKAHASHNDTDCSAIMLHRDLKDIFPDEFHELINFAISNQLIIKVSDSEEDNPPNDSFQLLDEWLSKH